MIDALGNPQSLLLVGGTSEIGLAVVERLARDRLRRVVLAARPSERLDAAADRCRGLGLDVVTTPYDAHDRGTWAAAAGAAFADGDVDVVLLAAGMLGDQARAESEPAHAVELFEVNCTSLVAVGVDVIGRLRQQGHGAVVVLSTVAAERPRKANFAYGATKAGLDAFFTGFGDALVGSGVHVLVVRPGFVATRMTEGMEPAPLSTTAGAVADVVADALRGRKQLVWAPAALRPVMSGLRHLPRPLFRRLPR